MLILANGVFAGAEIALVSLRKTRLAALLEARQRGAQALAQLKGEPERFLATIQIGITLVSTAAAAFGGASLAQYLEPWVARLPGVDEHAPQIALGVVVVAVAFLSLVLGELVPKSLALRAGERYALLLSRPLLLLSWLARPLVWLLTATSNLVLKPFSDRTNFTEARLSREELQQLVEEAAETGALDEQAGDLVSRALEFDTLTAAQVMIPRNRIVALSDKAQGKEILRALQQGYRSRLPVYGGNLDNVIGFVSVKDLLLKNLSSDELDLKDIVRPILTFHESVPAIDVLTTMQNEQQRMAMVIDEHGGLAGLLTLEDLLEELVGEVFTEHERTPELIKRQPNGAAIVRGEVTVRDVNRELELDLEEDDGANTIGGLCIKLAGGLPHRGARLAAGRGVVLVPVDVSVRAVRRVRVEPTEGEAEGSSSEA